MFLPHILCRCYVTYRFFCIILTIVTTVTIVTYSVHALQFISLPSAWHIVQLALSSTSAGGDWSHTCETKVSGAVLVSTCFLWLISFLRSLTTLRLASYVLVTTVRFTVSLKISVILYCSLTSS